MQEPVYYDPAGRAYTVRDGASVWLDGVDPHLDTAEYAGFGIRLAARCIDLAITFVIAFVSGIVVYLGASIVGAQSAISGTTTAAGYALSLLAATAFYVTAEAIHGSTPGKMALGLTVRSDDGGNCDFVQALKREVAFFLDSLFFGILALSTMKKSPRQQRMGDRWASTVVVKTRSLSPANRRSGLRFAAGAASACLAYAAISGLGLLA